MPSPDPAFPASTPALLAIALWLGLSSPADAAPLCEDCGPEPARASARQARPVATRPDIEQAAASTPDAGATPAAVAADPGTPGLHRLCRPAGDADTPVEAAALASDGVALVGCRRASRAQRGPW